jgi:acetyl esterase/lipase
VGDLETDAHICHHICAHVPCCVIDVDYRLIPEYPFPIGIMDGLSAVQHVLANHRTFSIDPENVTFGGESSGATIALILNHIFRDAGNADFIKGVVVGTPTISDVRKYATPEMSPWPSMQESQYAPLLNWEKLKWFDTFKWMSLGSNAEVSQKEQKRDISWFADALKAPNFKELAPLTWIGTAEFDPLRDEAEAYADKIKEAGNKVLVKRFPGVS